MPTLVDLLLNLFFCRLFTNGLIMAEYHVKVIKGTISRVSADTENQRPVRITNCEHFCEIWYREILKVPPNAFIDALLHF